MCCFQLIIIAIGLAMDAFAVSVSSGVVIKKMRVRHAMKIAAFFGGFQALMPFIGWEIANLASDYVKSFDHWIAFALLSAIGGKMIYEAKWCKEEEEKADPLNLHILILLSIATSIDALAVGITFSCLGISIVTPIILIGLITFAMSFAGTYIGDYFGHHFEDKLEILGGLILIAIGIKILIEHLFFT